MADSIPETPQFGEAQQQATRQSALLDAVVSKYVADRAAAVANLNNYLINSVGVGEHPDIVAEACRLFESIDKADSMIETIQRVTNTP